MYTRKSAPPLNFAPHYFTTPATSGRRITAGFTWLQRIGKAASMEIWFPEALRVELDMQRRLGHELSRDDFPAQWAAIRQVELLQEAANYKIYDMDATHLKRTLVDVTKSMRAGGYRLTIAVLGSYEEGRQDDLRIFDLDLQDRLAQMIHMLYLEEESANRSDEQKSKLNSGEWDYRDALPHVGATLSARDVFRPIERNKNKSGKGDTSHSGMSGPDRKHQLVRQFFGILNELPQKHILHDTAVGLQLPELIGENEWIYHAPSDETFASFNHLLNDLFMPFGGKPAAQHLRAHGDRLSPDWDQFYRAAARLG